MYTNVHALNNDNLSVGTMPTIEVKHDFGGWIVHSFVLAPRHLNRGFVNAIINVFELNFIDTQHISPNAA